MKQITAQDIINAYKRHPEIKPIFYHLFDIGREGSAEEGDARWRVTGACAVGILTIDNGLLAGDYSHFPQGEYNNASDFSATLLPVDATAGLIDGFEGRSNERYPCCAEYSDYFAVGAEARTYATALLARQEEAKQ